MALQSAVNSVIGPNYLSESSFVAGIVSMAIHLDQDCYNGKRTPFLHSVFFGTVWSLVAVGLLHATVALRLFSYDQMIPFVAVFPTAFTSHLLSDCLTEEGIYLFPRSRRFLEWFRRKPDPENSWVNWERLSLCRKRKNDDPILNLCASSISLVVLIALLALTPL
jgi:hypothetical protein